MDKILEVRDLRVHFPIKRGILSRTTGFVKAVDGVSFDLAKGETLGIVGESGSGKTTIARVIAGLQKPTSGDIICRGRVSMVFQDPLGSLNPRMTVGAAIDEILNHLGTRDKTAIELLRLVGLDESCLNKYPHEFSGGQRQRICIAKAVASRPDILICDEAVSALDLSIRSTILDLLDEIKKRLSLALLFITHDLGVVSRVSDRILVMRAGLKVEEGPSGQVLRAPTSDYTRELLLAVPKIGKTLT